MASAWTAITTKYRMKSSDDFNQCLVTLNRHLSSSGTIDRQTEPLISTLRELYLIILYGHLENRIPENVSSVLLGALSDIKVLHPQLLAVALPSLLEMTPGLPVGLTSLEVMDVSRIPVLLRLMRAQDISPDLQSDHILHLLRLLNDAVPDPDTKRSVLIFLCDLLHRREPVATSRECFDMVSWSAANWLVNASIFDDSQAEKNKRSKDHKLLTTTELDGTTPSEFFTVMSLAKAYSEDQLMNIATFSVLYDLVESSSFYDYMTESQPDGPLAVQLRTLKDRVRTASFLDAVVDYCVYLIKQSELRPNKSWYDREFQDAVVSEAVRILELACNLNPTLIRKAFRAVMDVNDRAVGNIHSLPVLLQTIQFMITHGEQCNYELDTISHFFCCNIMAGSGMQDPIFSSEILYLCLKNEAEIRRRTRIFSRYFPAIFKILAWSPRANLHIMAEVLPSLISPNTYIEIFHHLIDLPCVTACLEVSVFGERSFSFAIRQVAAEIENSRFKYTYDYLLRNEAGRGDALESMSEFHRFIKDTASHPRVTYTSQAVPVLLSVYLTTVTAKKDELDLKRVLTTMLDRMHSLFRSYDGIASLQRVMSDGICLLFATDSTLLSAAYQRIADYILANHFLSPEFLTSLIWCIGKHAGHSLADSKPEILKKIYDAVEFLTYDIIKTRSSDLIGGSGSEEIRELFRTSMSTMTKLGAMSYDLTRRTVICLNNVIKKTKDHPEALQLDIHQQVNKLIEMLALPSVREIVMNLSISPEPEVLEALELLESKIYPEPASETPSSFSL